MRVIIFYKLEDFKLFDSYKLKAECSSKCVGTIFGFFFVCRKMANCRSPPLFNLILKKQIEWRKERWQIAQKEENIGIIHIF